MSPDQIHLGVFLVAVGGIVFLLLLSWALDYRLSEMLALFAYIADRRLGSIVLAVQNLLAQREGAWVDRANAALGNLQPPPRKPDTLEGWSWRPIERDPLITVKVQSRSADGRRLEGYVAVTPGTLQVSCRARTSLALLEGWITVTTEDSPPVTLRAGDSLVIEPGFHGQWQIESFTHLNFRVTLR